MSKEFLVFPEHDVAMLNIKEEAGLEEFDRLGEDNDDSRNCPLDVPSLEMFNDFMFPDGDAFRNYRESSLSPTSSSDKNGNLSSVESVSSPEEGKLGLADVYSESDSPLSSDSPKAPFIPMEANDDLPLIADDLMWSPATPKSVSCLTSETPEPVEKTDPTVILPDTSSLAKLLRTNKQVQQRDSGHKNNSPTDPESKPQHSTAYHLKRTLPVPEPLGAGKNNKIFLSSGKDVRSQKDAIILPTIKKIRTCKNISDKTVIVETVNSGEKVTVATTSTQTSTIDILNPATVRALSNNNISLNLTTLNGHQVIGIIQAKSKLLSTQKQIHALRLQQQQIIEQQKAQQRKEWEAKARESVPPEMRNSVLLNLLITGKDVSAGYSCPGKSGKLESPGAGGAPVFGSLLGNSSNLLEIPQQDCDVNAPILESSNLLHGVDILQALDNM